MLSIAAFDEGRYAQAFPSFGSERMGAPVTAFCRIDDREIRLREPISKPDALIIQDPTLLHQLDLFSGLSGNGYILINSTRSLEELGMDEFTGRFPRHHCCTVPASELALKHVGRPLPNAALLGAFAAVSGQFRLDSVLKAIRDKFAGRVGEANAAAAQAAYDLAEQPQRRKVTHA
jgi:pyruvate ferredoxin oxidoreductase gamma subunit